MYPWISSCWVNNLNLDGKLDDKVGNQNFKKNLSFWMWSLLGVYAWLTATEQQWTLFFPLQWPENHLQMGGLISSFTQLYLVNVWKMLVAEKVLSVKLGLEDVGALLPEAMQAGRSPWFCSSLSLFPSLLLCSADSLNPVLQVPSEWVLTPICFNGFLIDNGFLQPKHKCAPVKTKPNRP